MLCFSLLSAFFPFPGNLETIRPERIIKREMEEAASKQVPGTHDY